MARKSKQKWEYGDFQTPIELAAKVMSVIHGLNIKPNSILEPTCGTGSFLLAAAQTFQTASKFVGVDICQDHLAYLETQTSNLIARDRIRLVLADFFLLDWPEIIASLPAPILIVGNPPWVTSAELGLLQSKNLPQKSNFQRHRGYDALTGKSNFDISEWMLLKHLDWLKSRPGLIAVLCKTAVARKVLLHAWNHNLPICLSRLYLVDAQKYFDASVDACLLLIDMLGGQPSTNCIVYDNLEVNSPSHRIGYHDGIVLSDVALYMNWRHLRGTENTYKWRSGIKHDCAKVIEIERVETQYKNSNGEVFPLEDDYVYPMLKSSDIGNGEVRYGRKYMLVTQQQVGQDTTTIKNAAPQTWHYLENHQEVLAKRASSIYRKRPKYSMFGVGPYSFSPWKVAISGFYKNLSFKVIQPFQNRPVVLDDTTYFIPCWDEAEAHFIARLLNSQPAQQFYRSMVFWSDKRPITMDILQRLSLCQLSVELDLHNVYLQFLNQRSYILTQGTPDLLSTLH